MTIGCVFNANVMTVFQQHLGHFMVRVLIGEAKLHVVSSDR